MFNNDIRSKVFAFIWGAGLFVALTILAGSVFAQTTGYRLPWPFCGWRRVLQGWGGSYSHNNTQMWYAYDFSHAEGTPVRAARSGTVKFVRAGETICGGPEVKNKANYVTIYHTDETATLYLHLKDVYVSVNNWVGRGQTIGTAGKTGWTNCNPHLHFQRQAQGGWITNSQPIYFDEYPGQQLQTGQWYQSQNYWPGDHSCPTRVEAFLLSGLLLGSIITGTGTMMNTRRRRTTLVFLSGILVIGALVLGGCGGASAQKPSTPTATAPSPPPTAVPLGPHRPAQLVTPAPVEPTASSPPPPTPGPRPTPRPVVLPSEAEAQKLTAGWKRFEDPELGLRFRYPPEYAVRTEQVGERQVYISIDRPATDPLLGEYREIFDGFLLFYLKPGELSSLSPEGVEAWIRALPEDEKPAFDPDRIRVEHTLRIGQNIAFVITEPAWPDDGTWLQTLIIVGRERLVWDTLGDMAMGPNPRPLEEVWPLQMAFLATLEVTR